MPEISGARIKQIIAAVNRFADALEPLGGLGDVFEQLRSERFKVHNDVEPCYERPDPA